MEKEKGLQMKEQVYRERSWNAEKVGLQKRSWIAEKGEGLQRKEQDCEEWSRIVEKEVGLRRKEYDCRERNKIMMERIAEKERNL